MKNYGFVFSALLLFSASTSLHAFKLTPVEEFFSVSGKDANKTFQVQNNTEKAAAIQVDVRTRSIDKHGKETRLETKDFIIFPEQLILAPGKSRSIRVSYVGNQSINQEVPYRLLVSQLPVDLDKKKLTQSKKFEIGINFMFEYHASIYVVPPGVKPDITVSKIRRKKNGNIVAHLKNIGTEHDFLKNYNFLLSNNKGWKTDLSDPALGNQFSVNLLPGSERVLELSVPRKTDTGRLSLSLEKKQDTHSNSKTVSY